jgi:hypothetical protein
LPLYQKRPVVIEARQIDLLDHDGMCDILGWANARGVDEWESTTAVMAIDTLEGTMCADGGDYIIKGVQGEFYPCKPDIFELTYEAFDADAE